MNCLPSMPPILKRLKIEIYRDVEKITYHSKVTLKKKIVLCTKFFAHILRNLHSWMLYQELETCN